MLYAMHETQLLRYLNATENVSASDRTAAFDRFGNETPDRESIVTMREDGIAVVAIIGVLTPSGPSPIARFFGFGGTGYHEIIEATSALKDNASVTEVVLMMNTPGGLVDTMDQARQAIASLAAVKRVRVENHGLIASAGYYLATAEGVDEIVAVSALVETGNIGIQQVFFTDAVAMEKAGFKEIVITSSNAPNKNPDPDTDAGRQVYQDEMDAVERVFISNIAAGRSTTVDDVEQNYGRGALLIASDPGKGTTDAISVGMLDRLAGVVHTPVDGDPEDPTPATAQEHTELDKTTLKTTHPATYAQIVEVGVAQERERVEAHLTLGEASGDMALAVACITEGRECTPAINAKYMAASIKQANKKDRAGESEAALDLPPDDADAADTALAAATAQALGVSPDA